MRSPNRELLDRLAAEYVLGTLRGRARRRFESWLVSPQVGALVNAWENRLAGLEPPLQSVVPPASVWRGIQNKLELRRAPTRSNMRWIGIAASLVFFGVLGLFLTRDGIKPPVVETPVQLATTKKAFIQDNPETIYWRVELRGDNEELSVHVHKVHDLDAGKALELWALPDGGTPVSLGVLPTTGDHHRVLTAAQRSALAGSKQIAVSLEPAGGSPTGAPTGPVLHVAPLAPA
jgi:anti-sigma-K factor RskA